jgi:predicted RNA binding protein YcfA (HicA-like mRNA interferase family)
MTKWNTLLEKILNGSKDSNISFYDLCGLLERLGFEKRIKGSHHIFRKNGISEKPNLQKSGNTAKPYQVKQVREIIVKYKLGEQL